MDKKSILEALLKRRNDVLNQPSALAPHSGKTIAEARELNERRCGTHERITEDPPESPLPPDYSDSSPTLPSHSERFAGGLMGLAAGDALGTSVEFLARDSFPPLVDMIGGGSFYLHPGEWTDDTSMALCLCDSLLERRRFDPIDQLERYLRWYQSAYMSSTSYCVDVGSTTQSALNAFMTQRAPYVTSAAGKGNGSLMRLVPVPLAFSSHPELAIDLSGLSSRTTHGSPEAIDTCRYLGALIVGALQGATKDALLRPHFDPTGTGRYWVDHPLCPPVREIADGSYKSKPREAIVSSGLCTASLESALWAFHATDTWASGALLAANLGGDADTITCIYGQLAGVHYGERGIPLKWRSILAKIALIQRFARGLETLAGEIGRRVPTPPPPGGDDLTRSC